ncbi:hypothetical protein CCACVL1_29661 [Corchorus capsularis]|uniref:AMP deaminase n=1 Tax=Corchorus capsularis TaxID=210143 RepID=A0A1R3G0M5_COCAP|nr:hypothetical protein CCACVL1_29661 [Corchorus capsularis]
MAALLGASLMAISAFYIHKRSVDHVIDRLVEIRRECRPRSRVFSDGGSLEHKSNLSKSFEEQMELLRSNRMSSSMPNVALRNEWFEEDAKFDQAVRERVQTCSASSLDKLNFIPSGLPPLQTSRRGENQTFSHGGSTARLANYGRLMTPRSPGGNAFESAGDSDEEGTEPANEDDILFGDENIDGPNDLLIDVGTKVQNSISVLFGSDGLNSVLDKSNKATGSEAKNSVDLHGNGKLVDSASVCILENDPVFDKTSSALRSTLHETTSVEEEEVRKMVRECLELRDKYVYREEIAPWTKEPVTDPSTPKARSDPFRFEPVEKTAHNFKMEDGVIRVYASESDTVELFPVASSTTFFTDMHHLLKVMSIGNVRSACHHRLRFLEEKFRLHLLVNADREFLAQKGAPHRDFYNIRKVDTHVHHSACMNQKHLLRFIKSKLRKEPDEVVIFRDGKYMTLKEVFESLDLTGYDLNVDLLDVHADKSTFHRFDKFNLKYNPCGQSRLREIFLKQDNLIQGRFLAEVTKQVLSDLEASKYQMAEYRISIYGRKQSEWDQLASWFINNEIYSENAVWLIQVPRLYNVYKQMGIVKSFQSILDNVFIPLFEVTIDPNSHPQLHVFLMMVVGFDLVDDESKPERRPTKHMPKPSEWTNEFNPAYSYYAYYFYANLYTLNKLRESKGLPTIKLRPHCGEAGDIDHLAAAFLLCNNISHGIKLRNSPVLQYLYYLAQVGLALSPLSNNSLFLDYHRNPFPAFFQRGLNVSLSSDDPLQIHLTKEALVEEYSVAAQVWKLSACDLCEIARNSVYQSGFSHLAKSHWLGSKYFLRGPEGNDIHKTNVPNMRIAFRHETWKEEMQYVYSGKARIPGEIDPAM